MVSVESKRSRKSGYPGKSSSNIPVENEASKPSTVNNYYVGSRHEDYNAINEERETRIKKERAEANKLKLEKNLQEEVIKKGKRETFQMLRSQRQSEYDDTQPDIPDRESLEFPDEYEKRVYVNNKNSKMRRLGYEKQEREAIKAGKKGFRDAIRERNPGVKGEIEAAGEYIRDTTAPIKNKVLNFIQNPDNQEAAKKVVKGVGKAIQNTTENLNKDLVAYGQAKAIMNGTGEYSEKIVKDKYGNVIGVERTFKQHGKDNGKDKNTFGLKTPIKARGEKPGPIVRKATLVARKGTLAKNRRSMWDKEEKTGPTNHRRSGVSLTNKVKQGIGTHRRSGVKIVKSNLPTLEEYNEAEPNMFNSDSDFQGFAKKSFEGFEKKPFEGFTQKEAFHPFNRNRQRANFESTVSPQHNMLGRI